MELPEVIVSGDGLTQEDKSKEEREILLAKIKELEGQVIDLGGTPKTTSPISVRYKSWSAIVRELQAKERTLGKRLYGVKENKDRIILNS